MAKKVINCRKWCNSKLGKLYMFSEEYNSCFLNMSKVVLNNGIACCYYILKNIEAGLDCRKMANMISMGMKRWRKSGDKYISIVFPKYARNGVPQYCCEYYQKMEEPSNEFADDFEKAALNCYDYE